MPEREDELDAIVRELVASPLDEFTARRNARVQELRASGARELAAEVAKLRRPSVALWVANRLAADGDTVAAVRKAMVAATDAQARGAADELRGATAGLQQALDDTAANAKVVSSDAGHHASDQTALQVREIVRLAALSGADDWQRLLAGTLVHEPSVAMALGPIPVPRVSPEPQHDAGEVDDRARHEALSAARRKAAHDARALERSAQRASRLRAQADELMQRAAAAERQAEEAAAEADHAREEAAASAAAVESLEQRE